MSLTAGSETEFGETPLLSLDASETSHDSCPPSPQPISRGVSMGPTKMEFRMHSTETAAYDVSSHKQSPSQLFRIRIATYGASFVITLGICSVPALAICCFGEEYALPHE